MPFLHPSSQATAMTHGEREISYEELHKSINHLADRFGAWRGERIAIFAENRPEWVFALYGAWRAGVTVIPIDPMSSVEELTHILADGTPGVVVCSRTTRKILKAALGTFENHPELVDLDEAAPCKEGETPAVGGSFPEPDANALALIIYTSGTTGDPKGVMLTFSNLESNRRYVERVDIYDADTRVIALLPFHHSFPLMGCIVAPLSVGAMSAIVDDLSAEAILATLVQRRITIVIGVPRLYKLLHAGLMRKVRGNPLARLLFWISRHVGNLALSRVLFRPVQKAFGGHIAFFISGGARLDPEVNRELRWLGFETLEGYGLTETSPMSTYNPPGAVKVGSVGIPIDGVELKVEQGELLIRGPNVMRGYYGKVAATTEAIRGGWFHSGDLGHIDENGYVFITGRSKEIIILDNGKNINPEEIETKIAGAYPLVREIGVYQTGERLAAIVVPSLETARAQGIVNLEEAVRWSVIDSYNRRAAPYKRITELTVVNRELPRTRLGKLRRFALPTLETRRAPAENAAGQPEGPEYLLIKGYLEELKGTTLGPDQHLELDLGLDSLDKVELLAFLEHSFGVRLDEELLLSHTTPRELAATMAEQKTRIEEEFLEWRDILTQDRPVTLPRRALALMLLRWVFHPFSRLYFRLDVQGLEKLPQRGAFIITPNHQSHLDGLIIATVLRAPTLKNTYFFAKEKHFASWWRRLFATNSNIIVMNLNRELKESVQKIAAVLRRGKNMVIFPEGTRSQDGTLLPFKKIFAILSKELDVPVVPVAINGSLHSLASGKLIPRPARIRLEFLSPIHPGAHDYTSLTTITRDTIQNRCPPSFPTKG